MSDLDERRSEIRKIRSAMDVLGDEHTSLLRQHSKEGWASCQCDLAKALRTMERCLRARLPEDGDEAQP